HGAERAIGRVDLRRPAAGRRPGARRRLGRLTALMATLFLIRHALTAQTGRILYGQAPGIDLDDRGRAQAERLVERFAPVRLAAVDRSARRHPRGRVAIASHGDIVRIVLAHLLATPLDDFQRIVVDAASVSVIVIDGSQRRVVLANDTGGLERFGEPALAPWE